MSGVGRGRGWLHLKQNTQEQKVIRRPGSPTEVETDHQKPKSLNETPSDRTTSVAEAALESENGVADLLFIEDISEWTNLLNNFSVQDDGIRFNQKLKYLLDYLKENCANSEELDKAFLSMYNSCLHNAHLIPKLMSFATAPSMQNKDLFDRPLKHTCIMLLQRDYERCEKLQKMNKPVFRNFVQMFGEWIRLSSISFRCLHDPFLKCLNMLLDSTDPLDLNTVAKQICFHEKFLQLTGSSPLLVKLRKILITRRDLPSDITARLLLCLDIVANKSCLLSADVVQLYRDMLEDEDMSTFQGPREMLSVQTNQVSKTLDAYQSKVNVLQVSSPSHTNNSSSPANSSNNLNSTSEKTTSGISTSEDSKCNRMIPKVQKKHGRPILGAGATLNNTNINDRLKVYQPRAQGLRNSGISGMDDNKSKSNKSKKGWEHDDRV